MAYLVTVKTYDTFYWWPKSLKAELPIGDLVNNLTTVARAIRAGDGAGNRGAKHIAGVLMLGAKLFHVNGGSAVHHMHTDKKELVDWADMVAEMSDDKPRYRSQSSFTDDYVRISWVPMATLRKHLKKLMLTEPEEKKILRSRIANAVLANEILRLSPEGVWLGDIQVQEGV